MISRKPGKLELLISQHTKLIFQLSTVVFDICFMKKVGLEILFVLNGVIQIKAVKLHEI